MMGRSEKYLTDVIKGERTGIIPSVLQTVLLVFSWLYGFVVEARNWAYDNEWLRQYHPPIPVIVSIGNIVAGGTGKTPVTILLANAFYEEAKIGILTRGYRSQAEKLPSPVTLSSGKGPLHSAAYCGDEPYLMAENLPKACIFVGRDRQKSALMASKAGVDLALMDDGMQHRRIARDYEVVVMDVGNPFGCRRYIPRGFLRENPEALARADLIVLNHVDCEEVFERCRQEVSSYTGADMIGVKPVVERLYDLQGNEISSLEGKKVAVFCGIGQPERFISTVKGCGAEVVGQEIFSDHAALCPREIGKMADFYKAMGAEMLVCTEKDKVKIPEIPSLSLPIAWLKMQVKVVANEDGWQAFVEKIRNDLINRAWARP